MHEKQDARTSRMLECVGKHFPRFARLAPQCGLEYVLPPATDEELAEWEEQLGVPLPPAYKALLKCAKGFWLMNEMIRFDVGHPFFHDFEPFEELTPQQQDRVRRKGGQWPPPSQGMLCFAEFNMEADGDQVLFDVSQGLIDGEYPIYYYDHEASPAAVRPLASSFPEFMESFLEYPEFDTEE